MKRFLITIEPNLIFVSIYSFFYLVFYSIPFNSWVLRWNNPLLDRPACHLCSFHFFIFYFNSGISFTTVILISNFYDIFLHSNPLCNFLFSHFATFCTVQTIYIKSLYVSVHLFPHSH